MFSQIIEVRSQVAQNTEALKSAQTEVNDLQRQIQTLEIDLESQRSLVRSNKSAHASLSSTQAYLNVSIYYCDTRFTHWLPIAMEVVCLPFCQKLTYSCPQRVSLEGTLRDTEMNYNMEIKSLNNIILGLEAELTQLRNKIQLQTQDYEALLNTKMKLEVEIATYRKLLDGEDFTYVKL